MRASTLGHRPIVLVSMVLIGMCTVACGPSSTPTGAVGREAGLWKGAVKIQNIHHTGKDGAVQRLIEESSGTTCQPDHPPPQAGPGDGATTIRRVIEIPEDGVVIIVEVPRKEVESGGPVSLIVRRQASSGVMTEYALRAQPSPINPAAGVDVSVGSWSFTRLGDCPPGMKPFQELTPTQAR